MYWVTNPQNTSARLLSNMNWVRDPRNPRARFFFSKMDWVTGSRNPRARFFFKNGLSHNKTFTVCYQFSILSILIVTPQSGHSAEAKSICIKCTSNQKFCNKICFKKRSFLPPSSPKFDKENLSVPQYGGVKHTATVIINNRLRRP